MLDHVSIGVRNLQAAKRFYDAALKPLGYKCLSEYEGGAGFGSEQPQFWLNETAHPVPDDERSGLHVCFVGGTRKAVASFHAEALKAGGRDNGAPGLRPEYGPNYYGAFIVDPDGYRIEAHCGAAG